MKFFTIIFAILILSIFWGGFGVMLAYAMKLKSKAEPDKSD